MLKPFLAALFSLLAVIHAAELFLAVDDKLRGVYVNGVLVPNSATSVSWRTVQYFNITAKAGDVVAISVADTNAPAAVLGELRYKNSAGLDLVVLTNNMWRCAGVNNLDKANNFTNYVAPQIFDPNGYGTEWQKVEAHTTMISTNAEWIWSPEILSKIAVCKIKLPESIPDIRKSATLTVAANDLLKGVYLNGQLVPDSAKSASLDQFNINVRSGDLLAIRVAYNGSANPSGILAQINYFNGQGRPITVLSGNEWSCTSSLTSTWFNSVFTDFNVLLKAVNGNQKPTISSDATWIWATGGAQEVGCKIVLPEYTKYSVDSLGCPFCTVEGTAHYYELGLDTVPSGYDRCHCFGGSVTVAPSSSPVPTLGTPTPTNFISVAATFSYYAFSVIGVSLIFVLCGF